MDSEKALRLVRGLLAKAESTHSEHEAAALVAKARALMEEHSIDEQAARERGRTGERPVVVEWEFSGSDSNAMGKGQLLMVAARAAGVKVVFFSNSRYSNLGRKGDDGKPVGVASQWVWLTGFQNDVDRARLLYTSLLVQALHFAREDFGGRPPSGLLTSYLVGYSGRISARFQEREPAPAMSTALVVRRDEAVDQVHAERFPNLVTRRQSGGKDAIGRHLGRMAGDRADLGDSRLRGSTAQLT